MRRKSKSEQRYYQKPVIILCAACRSYMDLLSTEGKDDPSFHICWKCKRVYAGGSLQFEVTKKP